jgi:hypothetical protein
MSQQLVKPLVLSALSLALSHGLSAQSASTITCEVVIAGGSTAALSAALTSAKDGADTCLLEPFNQAGGQLLNTPAIDHAWHKVDQPTPAHQAVDAGLIDKLYDNQPPILRDWLKQLEGGGKHCWVAGFDQCFLPSASSFSTSTQKNILRDFINPALASTPNLRVYYNTVVRQSSAIAGSVAGNPARRISRIIATQRSATPRTVLDGFDARLSADLADWYSPTPSARWNKTVLTINPGARGLLVIDATEFGDVLATSRSAYVQGTESRETDLSANEACGQAFVFPFFMKYKNTSGGAPENAPSWTVPYPAHYDFSTYTSKDASGKPIVRAFSWSQVWAYRRVFNQAGSVIANTSNNQNVTYTVTDLGNNISLQNWTTGNDYPYRTLFKTKAQTDQEVTNGWAGGVDALALAEAEQHAMGWYYWLKQRTPSSSAGRITIGTEITGTASGLTRFPYLRQTRRSVGLGNFKLTTQDFVPETTASKTGRVFNDRVALSNYALDIHPITAAACSNAAGTPAIKHPYPYYIPFRALTNVSTENLLVAGKTIAQSFWASTSTRLQPEEFAQGQAAGAAASWMLRNGVLTTQSALNRISDVQATTVRYTPNNWRLQ